MENGLKSFALLETRALALGQRYREALAESGRLQQVVEKQAQDIAELETEICRQNDLFATVDAKMVDLLRQIDSYLPENEELSNPGAENLPLGNEQVLPGMHGN